MKATLITELYSSPNGDKWFLARDPANGGAFVRHEPNGASGGQITDMQIPAFLSGPRHPEQEALLRLIDNLCLRRIARRLRMIGLPRTPAANGRTRNWLSLETCCCAASQ